MTTIISPNKTILVVDDEPTNISVIGDVISSQYQVRTAVSGKKALENIYKLPRPDLVLLDVMMPEMDGYEVCRRIKSDPEVKDIPVIFVSALASAEEQILGFKAGAEDYIPKPVEPNTLLAKIHQAFENQVRLKNQLKDLDYAQSTAMLALTTMNEMGVISDYFCNLLKIKNITELGEDLIKFLKQFGLKAVVKISQADKDAIRATTNIVMTPIEISLLDKLKNKPDTYNYKNASVFNNGAITLLIINMPIEDDEYYGRLKEHVSMVLKGASVAADTIVKGKTLASGLQQEKQQTARLTDVISTIETVVSKLENQYGSFSDKSVDILSELLGEIEKSFIYLGLSETQESEVIEKVNLAIKKTSSLYDDTTEFEAAINMVKALIKI